MLPSPLTPVHEAAGARLRPPLAEGASPDLLTYGDVPAEYAAATEGCAVFDATSRGRLRVSGSDARELLHRILANRVLDLVPGRGNKNLLLSPKGKVVQVFDLLLVQDGEYRLSTRPGSTEGLRAALDMFLFTEDVQLENVDAEHAPLELVGPKADAVVRTVLGELPELEPCAATSLTWNGNAVEVTRVQPAGSDGWRLDAGAAGADAVRALWAALVEAGAQPAGLIVRDILRVEAGRAEHGVDVTDDIYPQEARLEDAFSLSKGCYVGQEVVAKIDTYEGLNKRLFALAVSHDDPVAPGTRLYRKDDDTGEWRDLGIVTSWAYSFVLDTGVVLAYVKRRHQEPGTEFRVGEADADPAATAKVVTLPLRPSAAPLPDPAILHDEPRAN